jgi:predicted ATPase
MIDSLEEREKVAQLNLAAGKRAKSSTAYASALTYFVAGRSLLEDETWEQRYSLIFALEFQRAECEFLTADFRAAEARLSMLSRRAADLVDSAVIARLQTELYTALDQIDRAVEVAFKYLRCAGVNWAAHPTNDEVQQEYERIWQQLRNRPIEALVDLPAMTDRACRATSRRSDGGSGACLLHGRESAVSGRLPENLGELSGSASTQNIHLKETILRMNKAGCIGNIFSIFAANRGYTQRVAFHFHRSSESGDFKISI